ncbi:type II toxin-antitoxin system RelE/ParE family toxin [Streptomyces sp. NBC_00047]|uniref:type II toxin-antitoxin system RelE/ParE family toxin n=1 Tax=Streptomyces sp. NBC_00047 TaxID=2975627 RepID=UPI00225A140B|nr:type II toxin-antitoxin system RelE/ParE family toxin [Streptomyces sp. NBC_00047]MCX5608261.1 type II toxin-antitoxin system RelE/ParE family toxin [Streptomyces sp. NBC_00047]
MDVTYGDRKVGKICESERDMRRSYGPDLAKKIGQRLAQLRAAETLEDMRPPALGKCHELSGDKDGCLSLHLTANWRLVFSPREYEEDEQGGLKWSSVTAVIIEEIEDYH